MSQATPIKCVINYQLLGGYKAINLLSEVVDEGYYGVFLGGWGERGGGDGVEKIPKKLFFSIIINQRWGKNDMLFSRIVYR